MSFSPLQPASCLFDDLGVSLMNRRIASITISLAALAIGQMALANPATAATRTTTRTTTSSSASTATSTTTSTTLVPATGLESVAQLEGGRDAWACGWDGTGIDVALIDTGVSPVAGTGKLVNGLDLSFDFQTGNAPYLDAFGHGTHLASIINGRDPGVTIQGACRLDSLGDVIDGTRPSATGFAGIAPGARVVNLKVGAADGAVDPTQVIAAIDWAVQHRNTDGYNIRVLALAYGVPSTNDATHDALSHAVEVARNNGIVVIASAGNDGTELVNLAYPARNPDIIAVGGVDTNGSTKWQEWSVAEYSDRGTATRGADFLTLGSNVPGLRVPGSYIDTLAPTTTGDRFVRGSGTSQAAAIAAGLAAQLLQRYPAATVDQIKTMLQNSAVNIGKHDSIYAQGRGAIIADRYLKTTLPESPKTTPLATIGDAPIANDRQDATLKINGITLTGEIDIQGNPFNTTTWAPAATNLTTWTGDQWLGHTYNGPWTTTLTTDLNGTWDGVRWNGLRWNGVRWNGSEWEGVRWNGVRWNGVRWN